MNTIENIISFHLVQKLGWALLHFIWQAAAVALLVAVLLRILRRFSANLRYVTACLALGLIVLLPVVTMQFIIIPPPHQEQPESRIPYTESRPQAAELQISVTSPPSSVIYEPVRHKPARKNYFAALKQKTAGILEPVLPHIVTGWLLGVFALSIWHLGGWTQLQRLRKKMVMQVNASLKTKLNRLSEKLGVTQAVELLESALVQIPTVVGWIKPVILLPAEALTGLTTEQLEAILAHELAHIKRLDYLVNMLQTVVEILGFYHPAVWWISHRIRAERENCCDDLAVTVTGDRVRYARALTSMEEIRGRSSELAVAVTGGNLFSRIRRLIGKDSSEITFSWVPAATVILLLAALLIPAAIAITSASETELPENEPSNAEKTNSNTKVLIETQIIHVSDEFLLQVGLDADSLKNSNSWTQFRVDDSGNPTMFVIDSNTKEILLKNVDESEGSSSISRIYLMALSDREATIKNFIGYDFKSQELGRFIKIKPELSQDGQSTSLDCELMIRRFENFEMFYDVYINKKVDRNLVPESEIVEYKVNEENAQLSNDHTLLILGGKLVSLRDVEKRQPILRHIPVTGELFNTTSRIEGQANEIILIKTTIVPDERNDDVDSKASSYNVVKVDDYVRIYLDLYLEEGQYVEIKDIGKRKFILKQVTADSIGKGREGFPAYASYIDLDIRSNFDLNLSTQRFTRGTLFEHDKWDAYFVSPDTITGNGYFTPTILCVCTWSFQIWTRSPLEKVDDTQVSLVAVTIKPDKPQEKSAEQVDPKQKQLNEILEKYSKGTTADKDDENIQSVCESVENYIAFALAGEDEKAAEYADPDSAVVRQTDGTRQVFQGQSARILAVCSSDWNALAISSVILADHGRIGPMIFHLKKEILDQKVHWLIDDIDIETLDSIEKEIKRFLDRNPQAKTILFKPQRLITGPTDSTAEQTNIHIRDEEKSTNTGKVTIKLLDPNSQPVVGAWVGTYVDWSDIAESPPVWFLNDGESYKESQIDAAAKVISNEDGKITLTKKELFKSQWPPERTVPLTAIDEGHYLAGLRELSRKNLGKEVTLMLQPGCHVRGRVTAATARKRKWSANILTVYVHWQAHRPCQYTSKQGRFEFVLPPGKYKVMVYSDDPDKAITLPIMIRPGQREVDLTKYLDGTSKLPAIEKESPMQTNSPGENPQEKPSNEVQVETIQEDSIKKLKQLGLAVAIYANKHENNLPETLDALKPYFADEQTFQWIQDNVRYFGKGMKSITGKYSIPIAYQNTPLTDKEGMSTLFSKNSEELMSDEKYKKLLQQGINVLYMDGHVKNISNLEQELIALVASLEIRSESFKKSRELGQAMWMYSNDHQGTWPDSLESFTPYLRNSEDIEWFNRNIAYLGKGTTANTKPDTIIAYDESFLSSVNYGTYVLLQSAQVKFLTPEKLKEHGISPAAMGGNSYGTPPPEIIKPQKAQQEKYITIRGRSLDADGRPIPNTLVCLYCQDYEEDSLKQLAKDRTDSEGCFSLGPIPALGEKDHGRRNYFLFMPPDGHGPAWKMLSTNTMNEEPMELTAYKPATISGTILTEDSEPISTAQVWIRQIVPPEATEDPMSRLNDFHTFTPFSLWSAETGDNGSFRISGVPDESRIQLVVRHPDFAGRMIHVKSGTNSTIKLKPTAVISGRVLYGKTNQPAAGVRVQIQAVKKFLLAGAESQTITDQQGRYQLKSLPACKCNIWAKAEGFAAAAIDSFEIKEGQRREAPDILLVEGGFITGKVIDAQTGKPVKPGEASDVAIHGPSRPRSGAAVEISRIQEDGSFRIRVAPGENYIRLRPRGEWLGEWGRPIAEVTPPSRWVDVNEGQTVEIEFRIRKFTEQEKEKEAARRSRTTIMYVIPKTLDEIENEESTTVLEQPDTPSSETEPNEPELSNQIMIYTRIIKASDEFLEFVGLDENSLKQSDTWSKYRVADSNDSPRFIIDKLNADLLIKTARARKDIEMHTMPSYCLSGKQVTSAFADQKYYILRPPAESKNPAEKRITKFMKVGTSIQLLPKLMEDRKNIQLDYAIKFNNLEEFQETKIGGKKKLVPKISTFEETSRNLIPNNKILLIRGEKVTQTTSEKSRTPILGDLPLVGGIFRSQHKITEEYTPLVLVQPTLLRKKQINQQTHQIKQPEIVDPNDPIIERLEEHLHR